MNELPSRVRDAGGYDLVDLGPYDSGEAGDPRQELPDIVVRPLDLKRPLLPHEVAGGVGHGIGGQRTYEFETERLCFGRDGFIYGLDFTLSRNEPFQRRELPFAEYETLVYLIRVAVPQLGEGVGPLGPLNPLCQSGQLHPARVPEVQMEGRPAAQQEYESERPVLRAGFPR